MDETEGSCLRSHALSGIVRQLIAATNALQDLADTVDGYGLRDQLLAVVARLDGILDNILDMHTAQLGAAQAREETP